MKKSVGLILLNDLTPWLSKQLKMKSSYLSVFLHIGYLNINRLGKTKRGVTQGSSLYLELW